jgi:hypothetical protein
MADAEKATKWWAVCSLLVRHKITDYFVEKGKPVPSGNPPPFKSNGIDTASLLSDSIFQRKQTNDGEYDLDVGSELDFEEHGDSSTFKDVQRPESRVHQPVSIIINQTRITSANGLMQKRAMNRASFQAEMVYDVAVEPLAKKICLRVSGCTKATRHDNPNQHRVSHVWASLGLRHVVDIKVTSPAILADSHQAFALAKDSDPTKYLQIVLKFVASANLYPVERGLEKIIHPSMDKVMKSMLQQFRKASPQSPAELTLLVTKVTRIEKEIWGLIAKIVQDQMSPSYIISEAKWYNCMPANRMMTKGEILNPEDRPNIPSQPPVIAFDSVPDIHVRLMTGFTNEHDASAASVNDYACVELQSLWAKAPWTTWKDTERIGQKESTKVFFAFVPFMHGDTRLVRPQESQVIKLRVLLDFKDPIQETKVIDTVKDEVS